MKPSTKSSVEVRSLLNDAWLGIQVKDNELFNPLATIPSTFENLPHIYLTHLLSTPDYFSFICKEILNVQLLPFQTLILKRLFEHKFPMLIMNRGSGKCVTGDTLVITDNGISRIDQLVETINPGCPQFKEINILGRNGFNKTDYVWYNGYNDTIAIETKRGYKLEGTFNHPILIARDNDTKFIELQHLKLTDQIIVDKSPIWFDSTTKHHIFSPASDSIKSITFSKNHTYDCHIPNDHTFLSNGFISHNSFLLGVYAWLRALLLPGRKIVIAGSTFRQSKIIFEYMEHIWKNSPILRDVCRPFHNSGPRHDTDMWRFFIGESIVSAIPIGCLSADTLITTNNGIRYITDKDYDSIWSTTKFKSVNYFHENGLKPVKKIVTNKGYEYSGTYDHKMKVLENDLIVWKKTEDIKIGDYLVIDRSERWFEPSFKCTKDQAYVLGAMLGDGTWTNIDRLQITGQDIEIVNELSKVFSNVKTYDNLHYYFIGRKQRLDWMSFWDMPVLTGVNKILPKTLLSAGKEEVAACLSGLFDTDGGVYITKPKGGLSCSIRFFNTSYVLIKQVQYILLHFGIIAKIQKREQRYSCRTGNPTKQAYELILNGKNIDLFNKYIKFRLTRKQEKLNYFLENRKHDWYVNDDIRPINKDKLKQFVENNKKLVKIIRDRKNLTQKTLTNILDQCSSENEYINNLKTINNSNYYFDRVVDIISSEKFTFDVHVPEDHEYCANGFISHNTGEGIRGLRANDILSDEFKCLRKNTLCETDSGLVRIQDLANERIINRYGQYESVTDKFVSKDTEVLEIITKYGFTLHCSPKHRVLTNNGWKQARLLTKNDYLINTNNYVFPKHKQHIGDIVLDKKLAWLLGLIIAEGSCKSKYSIGIYNNNYELLVKCQKILIELGLKPKIYKKKMTVDKRGWKTKQAYALYFTSKKFREILYQFGLEYTNVYHKIVPSSVLKSPKEVVVAFLEGLFIGDGSCFTYECATKTRLSCALYSVSERLIQDVQTLLRVLNIYAVKGKRNSKISTKIQHYLRINGSYALDLVGLFENEKWKNYAKSINLKSVRSHKYIYKNGSKYQIDIHNYNGRRFSCGRFATYYEAEEYWNKITKADPIGLQVKSVKSLNIREDLYDLTTLTTHSFFADNFIQHNSHDRTIFETVIAGFGAVSANPVDNVQEAAKKKLAKELKIHIDDDEKNANVANQLILSGTAYYQFNHFYEYFKRWKQIILSKGDKRKFETAFGSGSFSEDIDYKDYCVIRMPIELMPDGFMDQAQIARSRATMHSGNYNCEYGSVFSHDSNGFFKRSLIESCTVGVNKTITFPSCKNPMFHPTLVGNRECKYAIGVDPASEDDNFAINVIEIWPDHKRVIYNWTITKKEQKARLEEGDIQENDFFGYCARKIRSLMKNFNTCILGIDSQGGGYALMEALTRIDGLQAGELPIYEMIDPADPKDTDGKPGLHIIKKIQFADAKWVSEANNSLRLALEQKTLLFPFHDALTTEFAKVSDNSFNLLYDTLQDCIQEIEELKDELSTIIMTSTESGRDKWTTPDKKEPGMKKGKMRKDRYTALLISNSVADFAVKENADVRMYTTLGGFAIGEKADSIGPSYSGPSWISEKLDDLYD